MSNVTTLKVNTAPCRTNDLFYNKTTVTTKMISAKGENIAGIVEALTIGARTVLTLVV